MMSDCLFCCCHCILTPYCLCVSAIPCSVQKIYNLLNTTICDMFVICLVSAGTYIDKKCPFTGTVSIRGRIIAGTCHSAKMNRTIIVRRNYLHFVKKYQRYEKRHSNIPAHISPCFRVKEGDHVIIGQCRPLSKTVRFNVLKVIPAGSKSGAVKKAFTAA
jgi:ribosomal protein uS17